MEIKNSEDLKVIIIGNSPSILNHKIGHKIDNYDIVIRINRCVTEGFEEYIGSKIDIWSTSSWCLNKNPDNLKSKTSKIGLPYWFPINLVDLKSVWYRTPKTHKDFSNNYKPLYQKTASKGNHHILWKNKEFSKNFKEFCDKKFRMKHSKAAFDTGLLTILNSTLFFKDITIYGFDFYSESKGEITCYYRENEINENGKHLEDKAWARAKNPNSYDTAFISKDSTKERKQIIKTLVERKQIKVLNYEIKKP